MHPRIEMAEVLSFRLKIPRPELDRVPQSLGPELGLKLAREEGDLVLVMDEADSYLRFKPIGSDAVLVEIAVCNDDRALYFQKVLGTLMVRYQGDLHVKLTWNLAERNSDPSYAEARIVRGSTSFPGLVQPFRSLPPALGSPAAQASASPDHPALEQDEATASDEIPPEYREIEEILAKAKAHWEEYQRLKAKKKE